MLKLSRKSDLGLLLLADLTDLAKGKSMSLSKWATARRLPYRFLSKVAVELKNGGILVSSEGRTGGYSLKKPAGKISVGEVIKILEGPIGVVGCMHGKNCSAKDYCRHQRVMVNLSTMVEKYVDGTSLEDLRKGKHA